MGFNMTMGKRIALGITLMLLLMIAVGTAGYFGLNRVMTVTAFYQEISEIRGVLSSAKGNIDEFLLACSMGEVDRQQKTTEAVHADLDHALTSIKNVAARINLTQAKESLSTAEAEVHQYRSALNEYVRLEKGKRAVENSLMTDYDPFLENMEKGVLFHENMLTEGKVLKGVLAAYLMRSSEATWKGVEAEVSKLKDAINDWRDKVSASDQLKDHSNTIASQFQSTKSKIEEHQAQVKEQAKTNARMQRHKTKLDEICSDLGRASVESLRKETRNSVTMIIGFILIALVLGIGYAIFSIRSIVRKLNFVIRGISQGAGEVSAAATQVSASSQSLAQGASEQAASVEETSSSLEEMSSMTRQNADHAGEANGLMQKSKQMVESANDSMSDLTKSMEKISNASDETGKIIKAIDEIAFQTNLLALNAAVEAARAGQAGAGFAVVADEVRNLAMRAAEAAKNTAGMIEETIKRVKDGRALVDRTNETFKNVADSATKVSSLVAEIAAASGEQAQGIEQLNKAVADMDKVVQQTAAGAEESASASEEMNAQADQMKQFVRELTLLVNGAASLEKEIRQEGIVAVGESMNLTED